MENENNVDLGFDFLEDLPGLELAPVELDENHSGIEPEEIDLPGFEEEKPEEEEKEEVKEEEVEVEEEKAEEKSEKPNSEDTSLTIKFSEFFSVLKDNDLIKIEDGEEVTEESLINGLKAAAKDNAASQIYDLVTKAQGQKGWKLFEDIFVKGASEKYVSTHFEQSELETRDLSDEIIQEETFRQYLKETAQLPDDEIQDQIDFAKEKGKLEAKAIAAKAHLIKTRDSKKESDAAEAEERITRNRQAEQAYIDGLTVKMSEAAKAKEIGGVPLSAEDSKILVGYMTQRKYKLQNGMDISEFDKDLLDLRKDPEAALKLAALVKSKLNVTKIEKQGASKKSSFLFKEIENSVKKEIQEKPEAIEYEKLLKILDKQI
jgi:hypothetical protein